MDKFLFIILVCTRAQLPLAVCPMTPTGVYVVVNDIGKVVFVLAVLSAIPAGIFISKTQQTITRLLK